MSGITTNDLRLMLAQLQLKIQAQRLQLLSIIQDQQAQIDELKANKKIPTSWQRSTQPSPKATLGKNKAEMAKNLKLNLSRVNQDDVIELKKQIRESLLVIEKELTVGSPDGGSDNTTSATYTTLELQDMLESLLNMPTYKW